MYVYDSVVAGGDGDSLGASHVILGYAVIRLRVIWASPLLAARY